MTELAVLTGDIVKSQELPPGTLDGMFDGLEQVAARLARISAQPALLTRARGDGWQMATTPEYAMRAAVSVHARLRSIDRGYASRIGLAFGAGDVSGDTLADAAGPVFVASGRALDTIKANGLLLLDAPPLALQLVWPLLEAILIDWTPARAQVIWHATDLPKPTQADIARDLNISRQSVHERWQSAHVDAVLSLCEQWEAICKAHKPDID